jgi:segregation and condensation protein B
MPLDQKIEAILFLKAEPVSIKKLADYSGSDKKSVIEALLALKIRLEASGLTLVFKDEEVMLGTKPELGEMLEKIYQDELKKDLSKASLETLSIILYKGAVGRGEIDWIRGVNSSFILRNLSIRGLIEKIPDPKDSRKNLYKPTFELLTHMGLSKIDDLPNFAEYNKLLTEETANVPTEGPNANEQS